MKVQDIKAVITLIREKVKLNTEFILKNPDSAFKKQLMRENNELNVQLKTRLYNLDQVGAGYPSHGELLPDDTYNTETELNKK